MHSKIIVDGDCSHKIKRHLLLRRKVMTNLDSTLKSRGIILSAKVSTVKAMFLFLFLFSVVMYGCKSWTIKKAESTEEFMLLNCGAEEGSWESLGQQKDQTTQS